MEDHLVDFSQWDQKQKFIDYIKSLKTPRVIHMEHPQLVRSDNVNVYYRVVLSYISKDSGHSLEELNEIFVEAYLPDVLFGQYGILSTANISQEQMIAFIKKIKFFYQKFSGKYIPSSEEYIRPHISPFPRQKFEESFDSK